MKPPEYWPCPGDGACERADRCLGHCSQPAEAEYVNGMSLRTGEGVDSIIERLNRERALSGL